MRLDEVLVIDDSDTDLLYAGIVLDKAGVADNILAFGTAQDALDYLQRRDAQVADVILLDINMPEMNGFEFLEAYQRLHESHRARAVVVMLTSSPDPADRRRALAFDCVKGYVVKPIDIVDARALADLVLRVGLEGL